MGGQTITDPGQVDTIVAEMTGLPSEKFLRSTASVRHQELEGLDKDEGALRDRLQQLRKLAPTVEPVGQVLDHQPHPHISCR